MVNMQVCRFVFIISHITDPSKGLKKIYADHGWPNDYRRDECIRAIEQWWIGGKKHT